MSFEIRIANSDICFIAQKGQSILDAALKAGIELPYSCRKGVCGNCAGAVLAGEVQCGAGSDSAPLQGVFLCQCVALSDISIAPSSWQRSDPSTRRRFAVKVFRNSLLAPDVSLLQLRLPAGQRAKFKAGQYLQIQLTDGSRRSYSMANAPHENDTLQLHIRHLPGGRFSELVPTLQPGAYLEVELPFGAFELTEDSHKPMLCVVGGTGFAPVKSLLDHMVRKDIHRTVTLVWGARDRHGLYLLAAVERWQKLWPDFRFLPALEDPTGSEALQVFHGRVDGALRSLFSEPLSLHNHEVYCCGSSQMVAAVRHLCTVELGLPTDCYFNDVFVPGPAIA